MGKKQSVTGGYPVIHVFARVTLTEDTCVVCHERGRAAAERSCSPDTPR